MVNVRIEPLVARRIIASIAPESSPPDSNSPNGTSLTRWARTVSKRRSRNGVGASVASRLDRRVRDCSGRKYRRVSIFPFTIFSNSPGSSCWTPSNTVPGPGTYRSVRYCAKAAGRREGGGHAGSRAGSADAKTTLPFRPAGPHRVIERLDTQSIPDEQQRLLLAVPERIGEHPAESVDPVLA